MKDEMLLLQEQNGIDEESQIIRMRQRFKKNRNRLHIENHIDHRNTDEDFYTKANS